MEVHTDRNSSARDIIREVSRVIAGKDAVIVKVLLAILAGGHILMEDIPGVGKTTLAVSMSRALGLDYNRVQFTPDVLPSDITGYSLFDKNTGAMSYQRGAILCNLFLADELNRATSRTQSALLQAMEEGEVTVDNHTYPVPRPFIVIATQNPAGAKGTQLLPDSQLDRFMMRLTMGYPTHTDEIEMVRRRQSGISAESVRQIVTREELMGLQHEVEQVYVKDSIIDYIVTLCEKTRGNPHIQQGASPRASLALTALAKATAWMQKRDFVLPQDVRFSFYDCVEHRLIWKQEVIDPASRASVLNDIMKAVKAPAIQ
ncbi:MAG: MoxR family ATPase [Oscillospiraceae bacterium]|nr:MoxR family ATPase [Oscillospiraceae bacterium]